MIKKELSIFLGLFIFLALGMHMNQWLSHPFEHLSHLSTHKMPYHPLLYTFLLYAFIGVFRALIRFFKKLFTRL